MVVTFTKVVVCFAIFVMKIVTQIWCSNISAIIIKVVVALYQIVLTLPKVIRIFGFIFVKKIVELLTN